MRPLEDLQVLDLSRLVAGGMLTTILADFGAEVVKVEQPRTGDPLRAWTKQGDPLWWKVYARNKKSITLNLADSRGQALCRRLAQQSDLLVESFVPGTLERWNLGPEALLDDNPNLVIVRVSGWGQQGPYADRPGFGTLVEAASGFAALTGFPDRPPVPAAHFARRHGGGPVRHRCRPHGAPGTRPVDRQRPSGTQHT